MTSPALRGLFLKSVAIGSPWRYIVLMTVLVELLMLFLLVLISPIVKRLQIAPTDEELIHLKSTSLFCNKLTFNSPRNLSVYHVLGEVNIDHKTTHYSWTKTRFISPDNVWRETFHFLERSYISVTVRSDFKLKFSVIEGGMERQKSQIKDCYNKQLETGTGTGSDFCQKLNFTNKHSEEVEFTSVGSSSPTFADIKYTFNRTSYDVTKAKKSCESATFCEIPLSLIASRSSVVVGSSINTGDITPVTVQCQIRIVFLVSVLTAVLLFSFMLGPCFSSQDRYVNQRKKDYLCANKLQDGIAYGTFADPIISTL